MLGVEALVFGLSTCGDQGVAIKYDHILTRRPLCKVKQEHAGLISAAVTEHRQRKSWYWRGSRVE